MFVQRFWIQLCSNPVWRWLIFVISSHSLFQVFVKFPCHWCLTVGVCVEDSACFITTTINHVSILIDSSNTYSHFITSRYFSTIIYCSWNVVLFVVHHMHQPKKNRYWNMLNHHVYSNSSFENLTRVCTQQVTTCWVLLCLHWPMARTTIGILLAVSVPHF